jgi:hypothetical protein
MKRFKLLFASLFIGGLIGGLAVWPGSHGLRAAERDPLIGGTREICEAIVANEEARWEQVRQRYFARSCEHGAVGPSGGAGDALRAAHGESSHFHPGDAITALERNAEGEAQGHSLAAVAARVRTGAGERTITVRWARDGGGPWYPEDVISVPTGGAAPAASEKRSSRYQAP